jgi:hypothetical protein
MADSVRQKAPKLTSPIQGNNQLMLEVMGGGDKRGGQFGEGGCQSIMLHVQKLEGLG